MPKQRSPDSYKAEEMYKQGMKLVEIASQLNLPEGTVRRWKCTYKWDSERSDKKASVRKKKENDKKAVAEDVEQVMNNPDLTDKQRLFCLHYVRCFNATKAYQKAYGCSYGTAMVNGSDLLRNTKVRDEIYRLKQNRLNREMLDEHDIFQKYMDIAFADITDYVEFGREEIQVMGAFGPVEMKDPETGERVTLKKTVNTVRFKESDQVDGTLIAEVKQGKDGASVKLMDRMKALNWLAEHMDLATDTQKAQIEQIKANTERLRRDSSTEDDDGVEIINDVEKEETDKDIETDNSEVSAPV